MGLGPPVCEKCLVLYEYKHSYGWECPFCKINSLEHLNAWSCGLSEEQLEANKRLQTFLRSVETHAQRT